MTLDDAKSDWQANDDTQERTMADSDILSLVQHRSRAMDRTIRRRDLREIVSVLAVAVVVAPMLILSSGLTRLGALILVGAMLLIIGRLARARRANEGFHADWPFALMLRAERAKLDTQIELLESVLWWYIAPIAIGVVMIVAGDLGASWFTTGYTIAVALLAWGIYRLNQSAVRNHLRPRRAELTRLLAHVEGWDEQEASA